MRLQLPSAHVPLNLTASLRERTPWKWKGQLSPVSSAQPVSSKESAAPTGAQGFIESKRPRRSMPPDGGLQSSQPLLYGLVSTCSKEECSALFEHLRARQSQLDLGREGRERDAALNCDSEIDLLVSGV